MHVRATAQATAQALRLFALIMLLSLGGSFYITTAIMILVFITVIYRITKTKRPSDVLNGVKKALQVRKGVRKSFWLNWLRADKSPQTDWLSNLVLPSILFLVINVRFHNYYDFDQALFLLIALLPVLGASLGIRNNWQDWGKSSTILIPYVMILTILITNPLAMPVLDYYHSEAAELSATFAEGYGPASSIMLMITNIEIKEIQWFFVSVAILLLGFFSPFSSMTEFSASRKDPREVKKWFLCSIIYGILSYVAASIVTTHLYPFLLPERLVLLTFILLLMLLSLGKNYENNMQQARMLED
ncbi:hypothetical protein GTO27_11505 [Candidatus Bathyarchaeota archaeon]|nr:hypothetical protein [Candidatus Bathyarchaeota archaeon]